MSLRNAARHFDLRRHVERGGRLVEHHDVGLAAIAIAAIDPLQLTARHLVRIARADRLGLGSSSCAEQARASCAPARGDITPWRTGISHTCSHQRHRRIERRRGALGDIGDARAAQLRRSSAVICRMSCPVEIDLAADDRAAVRGCSPSRRGRLSICPRRIRRSGRPLHRAAASGSRRRPAPGRRRRRS